MSNVVYCTTSHKNNYLFLILVKRCQSSEIDTSWFPFHNTPIVTKCTASSGQQRMTAFDFIMFKKRWTLTYLSHATEWNTHPTAFTCKVLPIFEWLAEPKPNETEIVRLLLSKLTKQSRQHPCLLNRDNIFW